MLPEEKSGYMPLAGINWTQDTLTSRLLGSWCLRMKMKHKANSKTQGGTSQL